MTLRHGHHVGAIEPASVTDVVQGLLSDVAEGSDVQLADGLLGAHDSGSLAIGSGLHMSDQVEQGILIIGTGHGIHVAAQISGGGIGPQGVGILQSLLLEGLGNLADEVVEVNLTGQNAVQLLINPHSLEGSGDGDLAGAAQALTADTLSAIGSIGHDEQVAVLNHKDVLVAQSHVAEVNQSVEPVGVLQTLDHSAGQDLLNQSEQANALAVADVLVVQLGGAIVGSNQSLTQSVHGLSLGVFGGHAVVRINGHADNIIHLRHSYLSSSLL